MMLLDDDIALTICEAAQKSSPLHVLKLLSEHGYTSAQLFNTGKGAQTWLLRHPTHKVLATRGTEGPLRFSEFVKDWFTNFAARKVERNYGHEHKGYLRAAQRLLEMLITYIHEDETVLLIGHSQGGGISVLMAAELPHKSTLFSLQTYAAPRVVDQTAALHVAVKCVQVRQIALRSDRVAKLPMLSWGFVHIAIKWIGPRFTFLRMDHFASKYRQALAKLKRKHN